MSIPPDHSTAQSPQYPPPPDRVPLPAPEHTPPNSIPWWRRSWVIAAAAFVVGAGIAGAAASRGSAKTVAGPTVQITATATVHPTVIVTVTSTNVVVVPHAPTVGGLNDGTYLVGSQIQPGAYHTDGIPPDNFPCEGGADATCGCAYTRLSNLSGDPRAIIASDLFLFGPTTIQVERTDYALKLFGGCAWAKIG